MIIEDFIENLKKAAEGMKKPVVMRVDDEVAVFETYVPLPKIDFKMPELDEKD